MRLALTHSGSRTPTRSRGIPTWLGRAREAQEKGHDLYVGHGPPVPQFVVVSGTDPYPPQPGRG